VVHIDHGVGRYRGLVNLSVEGQEAEFLKLEYADEATLYVPVANLHMIARYSGADTDSAPLHRPAPDQWQKARRNAAEQVRDEAAPDVPVPNLHRIARYSGADTDSAPLPRLGSDQWQKARRKAAEKVRDVAAELLDVYARRAARKGYSFNDLDQDYQTFAEAF